MNLKGIAYKLQKALCLRGRYIRINQTQYYSAEKERILTKYSLKEKCIINSRGDTKDIILLETFRLIDIVNYLAEELGGGE